MIQINLLPDDLRPIKRTPLPYVISLLVLLIAIGVIAVIQLGTMAQVSSIRAERDSNQRRLEQLQPIVDEANELTVKKQQLAARIETINEIVSDRIIWSRQLYNVSRLAPDNFWFNAFTSETKRVQQMVRSVAPDGRVTERRETVLKPVFRVSGYVVDAPDGSRTVSPLVSAVEADSEFSSIFLLDSTEFGDTAFDGYPVRQFAIDFTIGPAGERGR